MDTNTVNNFFKQNGITGNIMIDTMIVSTLLPIIIGYMNTLFYMIKTMCITICLCTFTFVSKKLKTMTRKNLLCSIQIDQNNKELYEAVNDVTFKINKEQTQTESIWQRFAYVLQDLSKKEEHKNLYKKWSDKRKKQVNIKINNDYNNNKLFNHDTIKNQINQNKTSFTYKNYDIILKKKTILFGDDEKSKSTIIIKLLSSNEKFNGNCTHKYVEIIDEFFVKKLKIEKNLNRIYHIIIDDPECITKVTNLIKYGYLNSDILHLKYGDNTNIGKTKTIDNKNYMLNTFIAKNDKLSKKIIVNNFCDMSYILDESMLSLCCKYLTGELLTIFRKYAGKSTAGYYYNNNKLILVCKTGKHVHMVIISSGKSITKQNLEDEISYFLGLKTYNPSNHIKNNVYIFKRFDLIWKNYTLDRRTFDTIYLPSDQLTSIKKEIEKFLEMEKLYSEFQIPYRKGILLYGPPGTGKTSLVKAIAFEYQIPIYLININDDDINDDSIIDILNSMGNTGLSKKILLFEDIDSSFADKEKLKYAKKETSSRKNHEDEGEGEDNMKLNFRSDRIKYLTYSGLLNALDGVLSNQNGIITIMTTNYIEKLGDAFIRPGRIDVKYKLGECNHEQLYSMTKSIITKRIKLMKKQKTSSADDTLDNKIKKHVNYLMDNNINIKPCEYQQYLLRNIENYDNIFENFRDLKNYFN